MRRSEVAHQTAMRRVGIFFDEPGWAFHNIALNLARVAPAGTHFVPICRNAWFGRTEAAEEIVRQSDVVVFLWRFDLLAFLDTLSPRGWMQVLAADRPAFATVIYDHLYMSADDLETYGDPFVMSDAVAACSKRLQTAYAEAPHLPVPTHLLPDGVDTATFAPAAARRPGPVRIGWVGNSAWGATVGGDFKGRHTVLEPALERLRQQGLSIELHLADKAERRRPPEEMPDFYRDIDILVCASAIEGTPNPVLEAMATGTAVVSTDVGIVANVMGPEQRACVLRERSAEAMAEAVAALIRDPERLTTLKRENLAQRGQIAWETRWPIWDRFLDAALEKPHGAEVTSRLAAFRQRRRAPMERLRRTVAANRAAFLAYSAATRYCPGAIRHAKRLIQWRS